MAKRKSKQETVGGAKAELAKVPVEEGAYRKMSTLREPEIEQALLEVGGDIKRCAALLGVERTQLNRKVLASEKLKNLRSGAVELVEEEMVGDARHVLRMALRGEEVKKTTMTAAIFTMKCKGGWVEKREISGPQGGPIGIVVAPVRNLGPEDWKAQNQVQPDSRQISDGNGDDDSDQ